MKLKYIANDPPKDCGRRNMMWGDEGSREKDCSEEEPSPDAEH